MKESISIVAHEKSWPLVPVVTCVYGISNVQSVSAWLSFLFRCRQDVSGTIRLPHILSSSLESRCITILNLVLEKYLQIQPLPLLEQLCETVYLVVKGLSPETVVFVKGRFADICGTYSVETYWDRIEHASSYEDVLAYIQMHGGADGAKSFGNCFAFVIALVMLYGCSDDFRQRIVSIAETQTNKYKNIFSSDLMGLYLWPIDFSFVENANATSLGISEHQALLAAVQTINPYARVQICLDSHQWSRDVLAWIDEEFSLFLETEKPDCFSRYGYGVLNEGGNIIIGTAKDRFVLVARGAISTEFSFRHDLFLHDIHSYLLPDGFLWARNPVTGQELVLDSVHIDMVINVVPALFTNDNRIRVVVDPDYYLMIKENAEFQRFLSDQAIAGSDVVIIDKRERCLNLSNFSILITPNGEKRILFNKDRGHTLPRLNLKPDVMVQPAIEITSMACMYGCIRCSTNMLPESYVKTCSPIEVSISDVISADTRKALRQIFTNDARLANGLLKQWVARCDIAVGHNNHSCSFDNFSRTAKIVFRNTDIWNSEVCCSIVNSDLNTLVANLSELQGIPL
jgi:hypothetical protein